MNQVITQHGWGLDKSFWDIYRTQFQKNNWYWQDNERGYFSKDSYQSKWIKNYSNQKIKMVLCHSLGCHLIQKNLFSEASHIVLINCFNNFIPSNESFNLTLRALKRMEKKINSFETEEILKEFIHRSFLPNNVNEDFQKIFYSNLKRINNFRLSEDFKKLYLKKDFIHSFNKNSNVIYIKSNNDLILNKDSINNLIQSINKINSIKFKVIELKNQGHFLNKINLYNLIVNAIHN